MELDLSHVTSKVQCKSIAPKQLKNTIVRVQMFDLLGMLPANPYNKINIHVGAQSPSGIQLLISKLYAHAIP